MHAAHDRPTSTASEPTAAHSSDLHSPDYVNLTPLGCTYKHAVGAQHARKKSEQCSNIESPEWMGTVNTDDSVAAAFPTFYELHARASSASQVLFVPPPAAQACAEEAELSAAAVMHEQDASVPERTVGVDARSTCAHIPGGTGANDLEPSVQVTTGATTSIMRDEFVTAAHSAVDTAPDRQQSCAIDTSESMVLANSAEFSDLQESIHVLRASNNDAEVAKGDEMSALSMSHETGATSEEVREMIVEPTTHEVATFKAQGRVSATPSAPFAPLFAARFFASSGAPAPRAVPAATAPAAVPAAPVFYAVTPSTAADVASIDPSGGFFIPPGSTSSAVQQHQRGKRQPEPSYQEVMHERGSPCNKKVRDAQHGSDCEGMTSMLTHSASVAFGVVLHAVHSVGSEQAYPSFPESQTWLTTAAATTATTAGLESQDIGCADVVDVAQERQGGVCAEPCRADGIEIDSTKKPVKCEAAVAGTGSAVLEDDEANWVLVEDAEHSGLSSPQQVHSMATSNNESSAEITVTSATAAVETEAAVFPKPYKAPVYSVPTDGEEAADVTVLGSSSGKLPSSSAPSCPLEGKLDRSSAIAAGVVAHKESCSTLNTAAVAAADVGSVGVSVSPLLPDASGMPTEYSNRFSDVAADESHPAVAVAPWGGTAGAHACDAMGRSHLQWNSLFSGPLSSSEVPESMHMQPQGWAQMYVHDGGCFTVPSDPQSALVCSHEGGAPVPIATEACSAPVVTDDAINYVIDDSEESGPVSTGGQQVGQPAETVFAYPPPPTPLKPLHARSLSRSSTKVKVPRRSKGGLRGAAAFYGATVSYGAI